MAARPTSVLPVPRCRPLLHPFAPSGASIFGLPTDPPGSLNLKLSSIPLEEGISQYLASILAANTKYSVNREFFQSRHLSFSIPHARAKQGSRAPRKPGRTAEKPRKIWKLSTGPDFFRPRSKQERMTHKRRLVSSRQGFVFVTFVTPICCVSLVWIAGRNERVRGRLRSPDAPRAIRSAVIRARSRNRHGRTSAWHVTSAACLRISGKETRS
jgi:hypothetical protein